MVPPLHHEGKKALASYSRVRGRWMSKCHCVMTNVPGPKQPLIMAGQEIKGYTVPSSSLLCSYLVEAVV